MKKTGLVILAVLLFVLPFAAAAEAAIPSLEEIYSARGGVQFGMSIQEVAAAEAKNQLTSPRIAEPADYGDMNDVTRLLYCAPELEGIAIPLTPLGYQPSSLCYLFDADGRLFEIQYWFGIMDKSAGTDAIARLEALMTEKYGPALHSDRFRSADDLDFPLFSASLYDELLLEVYRPTVQQWIAEYSDGYVIADQFYYKDSSGKYNVYLAQRMMEKAQAEQALQLEAGSAAK